ncbi:MAG: DUF2851 family protein [Bacteroidota bacterium]
MKTFASLPEDFLHFVWRTRQYEPLTLHSVDGRRIEVRKPGIWNHDQGPDFLHARVLMGGVVWEGAVEIHVRSRDWYAHKHHLDDGYNGVVLHVVLTSDRRQVLREDGTSIPEVILEDYLKPAVIRRYLQLRQTIESVPCKGLLSTISEMEKRHWLERVAVERMEERSLRWENRLEETAGDWAQICWEAVMRKMGGTVNGQSFEELAQAVPYRIVRQYLDQPEVAEALLLGGLGLLGGQPQDEYHQRQQSHWQYYRAKHRLERIGPYLIKFARMRPANFPTIRISQSVALACQYPNLVDLLWQADRLLNDEAMIQARSYWQAHTRFGVPCKGNPRNLGQTQRESLTLNALVPLSFLYHRRHGTFFPDHFERYLSPLGPENNRISRLMISLGFPNDNAFFSQGLIRLYHHYCTQKRCLQCQIGQKLLVSSNRTS